MISGMGEWFTVFSREPRMHSLNGFNQQPVAGLDYPKGNKVSNQRIIHNGLLISFKQHFRAK